MELLLAERTLLLALDDDRGHDTTQWAGEAGLAGALLLDLGERHLLRADPDKHLVAVVGRPPTHPLLQEAYEAIRDSDRRRNAKGWVDRLQKELKPLRARLARGLVDRGLLSEDVTRVLGIFPWTRFPAADPRPEQQVRQALHDVLVTGRDPTVDESLLVGLLEPLGLIDRTVPKVHRRAARRRAKEIAEQGLAGSAVADAVREVQAAVMMAVVVPAVVASTGA